MNTKLPTAPLRWIARANLAKPGLALVLSSLVGCSGAPALAVAGAYFPAWLVCALLGIGVAVMARLWMIRRGYAQALPLQLWVCAALGSMAAVLVWYLWAGV